MRNRASNTPKEKKNSAGHSAEKTNEKKLKQARLPFQIIIADDDEGAKGDATVGTTEKVSGMRKRKLIYDSESREEKASKPLISKENAAVSGSKKKKTLKEEETKVVVLDTSDDKEESNEETEKESNAHKNASNNSKSGTPQNVNKKSLSGGSAGKLQIKLPLSGKKNKRRKSLRKSLIDSEDNSKIQNDAGDESSDDIEVYADNLNPQKRQKIGESSSKEPSKNNEEPAAVEVSPASNEDAQEQSVSEEKTRISLNTTIEGGQILKIVETTPNTDVEADDESDADISIVLDSSDAVANEGLTNDQSSKSEKGTETPSMKQNVNIVNDSKVQKKSLTPKQVKLMEQRRKAREEKERKLQEEKLEKQREKEEKELARKKEREEKDEQRRKEREDKEEQRRREREEKERKRLADLELKNEEKRKRNEAKEEELRKKEEERKRKEQEKEDEVMKKKKAAEAFTKFFVPKSARSNCKIEEDRTSTNVDDDVASALAFRPFQIRADMKLAPVCRKSLSPEMRSTLDAFIAATTNDKPPVSSLYLSKLKSGATIPGKWRRPSTESKDNDDVLLVEDELERVGLEIVEEAHEPVERYRAKYYRFSENRRPPFYGTWRKKTNIVTARKPFAQDTKYFDYEVDSDLEWEEEEPGESINGSEDEKEKESEDDEYEVDNEWFVPHGHLSEEELQNEDEGGIGDDNDREAQKAKLKILQQEFAQEMKKKTEKIKPRLIGCIWVDENGNQPALCPKIIWDTLNKRSMVCAMPPIIEEPEIFDRTEPNSPKGNTNSIEKTAEKKKLLVLSDAQLKDLIRLIHGNSLSKVFLIKEFIAYIEANDESIRTGEVRGPSKAAVREKIDEFAAWKVTETSGNNKRRKIKKRLCWIVSDDILNKMNMGDLNLTNTWEYILQPKKQVKPDTVDEMLLDATEPKSEHLATGEAQKSSTIINESKETHHSSITKFTKILTNVEKTKQLQNTAVDTTKSPNHQTSEDKTSSSTKPEQNSTSLKGSGKKRVALLMSVPRGQSIPAAAKNSLISKFLQKNPNQQGEPPVVASESGDDSDVILIEN